jgi:hypothetical protein
MLYPAGLCTFGKKSSPWADLILHVDTLGLATILGADEVNASIGRLVPSRYVEFLPLLGAFILAANRFTQKQPGFTLCNVSGGTITTEVAGWSSHWLKAQDFHQIHHKVLGRVNDSKVSKVTANF